MSPQTRKRASLLTTILVVVFLSTAILPSRIVSSNAVAAVFSLYLPTILNSEEPVIPPPQPTPEPPAPPPPSGVHILNNHSWYVDSINYLHIVGEIQNNTGNHLRFVKISANFYDGSGQLVATDFTYTLLDTLPAGDKTCFEVSLSQPTGWTSYQFESPSYWTDGRPLPNLAVTQHSGRYDSRFGWYEVIGQVRNDHGTRVEYVQPVVTLYNGSGSVVGCDFTFVNSTHLEPAQTSSFETTATGRDYADVTQYRIQVDGTPR